MVSTIIWFSRGSLVGYWKLNEAAGATTVADSSPSANNNGTVNSGVTLNTSGKISQAGSFNGTTTALIGVTSPSGIPAGSSSYTLSAWINPTSHTATQGIIGYGNYGTANAVNAFRLGLSGSTPQIINYWWANDLTINLSSSLAGGRHHVIATYNGVTRAIYVDGNLEGQDTPSSPNRVVSNFAIGRTYPSLNEYFNGTIDEVAIWSAGLTAAQSFQISS